MMEYNNIDIESNNNYKNILNMKRSVCCFCCKRYSYALCNYNSKIIDTYNEEILLTQKQINRGLWSTYIGDKLRLRINICFLLFTSIGLLLSYSLRTSDFVIISNGLNEMSHSKKYSFLEMNDVFILLCNIIGVVLCMYSVKNWVDKHKMNKFIKIAWFLFSLSTFIQIVIPPYYILDVFNSSIGENIVNIIILLLQGFGVSDSDINNGDANEYVYYDDSNNYYNETAYYNETIYGNTINETGYNNGDISNANTELLVKIIQTYMNTIGNCIIFIIMLPFMFRNNAVQISKIDSSYSKTAKVLHIILTFTEVFISIIVCNVIFMVDSYYWVAVCFAVFYNVWRQIQYFYNIPTTENSLMVIVGGFGITLISLYNIPIDSFVVNFLNSYFINKAAIQSIIYSKNKNNIQENEAYNENHIELFETLHTDTNV